MTAVANFLDEVVLTGSSADGPVQAWDVRTGMQLKAYKCVAPLPFFFPRAEPPTNHDDGRTARRRRPRRYRTRLTSHSILSTRQDDGVRPRRAVLLLCRRRAP